jgi:LytS/YehU family sensor histidine kinase
MSILVVIADGLVLEKIIFTDAGYKNWFADTWGLRAVGTWLLCGWIATYTALQKKNEEIEKKYMQQADAASLLKEAELFKLRQQLQPHFLYNSLNSISALTMIDPPRAQDMIGKLSDFLRSSVKRETHDLVDIKEELAHIQTYLSIESVRFGDRLHVDVDVRDDIVATLPPLLLQPLLENAIKFGLYGKTGQVSIEVRVQMNDDTLSVSITNPYDDTMQLPGGTGFGLAGVQRRLYLLYARNDLLEIKKENGLFTATLNIPQHVQGDNNR